MSLSWEQRRLDLSNWPVASEVARLKGLSRFVLLIHGFNNDEPQASASYVAAVTNLAAVGVPLHRLQDIWRVYWPGYVEAAHQRFRRAAGPRLAGSVGRVIRIGNAESTDVRHSNTFASALLYSKQVLKARDLGEELAEELLALTSSKGRPEIALIAHSLGCRVVLEVIRAFARKGRGHARRVSRFCLMAAAVPTFMLESGGRLRDCFEPAARGHVLFSRRDTVLRRAFRGGQAVAALSSPEEGRFPEAVGLRGEPGIWKNKTETMFRHGQYWREQFTAHHLARLFGVATSIEIPELRLVPWDLPEPGILPAAKLPQRRLQSALERRFLAG